MGQEQASESNLYFGYRCSVCFNFIGVLLCISISRWIVEFPSTISLEFDWSVIRIGRMKKVLLHVAIISLQDRLTINLKSYHDFLTRFSARACFCYISAFVWLLVCLLGGLSSHSRIFHSYGDITINGKGQQIVTYVRHSWPLSIEGSLARHT